MSEPKLYKNLIDGKWVEPASGRTTENRNPADTRDVIGNFPDSDERDVKAAVEAAQRAYTKWRLIPAPKRGEILFKAAQLLVERKEQFARDMTREMGKVLKETRGDVQEAIDMMFFMAGEGRRLYRPAPAPWVADQFPVAGPPPPRGVRPDPALELPDGHPLLKDPAGTDRRQHRGDQAGPRHAALDLQLRAVPARRRPARRRDQHRLRRRGRGRAAHPAPRRQSGLFHRLHPNPGAPDGVGRPGPGAARAGEGRHEPHHLA